MKKTLSLSLTHLACLAFGFALGIYALPLIIAPPPPSAQAVKAAIQEPLYETRFERDLRGSDFLHWGEGKVFIGRQAISFHGRLAPGPDYKLYLSPRFVQTEKEFKRHQARMIKVGDVTTFDNFIVPLPPHVDAHDFNAVVVWCEAFGKFISAAQYQ